VKLRRPLPLDPATFPDLVANLTLREVGALVLLGCAFWRDGVVRDAAGTARVLDVHGPRLKPLLPVLQPFFEPGGAMVVLRAAHIAKAGRRAGAARASPRARMARAAEGARNRG
jgi:hypothetical protein